MSYNKLKSLVANVEAIETAMKITYSGAYPFTFQQLIKHKNSL